jgi:hypothetical protein
MFAKRIRDLLGPAIVAALVAGCDTSRPGGGLTNGPPPDLSPEKPAVRTDLPPPDIPDPDIAAGRAPGVGNPAGGNASDASAKPAPDSTTPAPKAL